MGLLFAVVNFDSVKSVLALMGLTVPVIGGMRWLVKHLHTRRREALERLIFEVLEKIPPSQFWDPAAILRAIVTIKTGMRTYLDESGNLAERIAITFLSPSTEPRGGFRNLLAGITNARPFVVLRARRQRRGEQDVLERLRDMRERGLVEQGFTGHWRLKRQGLPGF